MKSVVVYYSKSGNTEKVARAIAAGLGAQAKSVKEVMPAELSDYDLICFGTPVHRAAPAQEITEFIAQLPDMQGKKAAVFCTKSIAGDKPAMATLSKALETKGMIVLGSFCAIGWSRFFADFGPRIVHRGHPSPAELAGAEEFGRGLMAKMQ